MKKLLAAILLACTATGAMAQTSQGTVVISGNFNTGTGLINSENRVDDSESTGTSFSIGIQPSIGRFVKDNLEIGAGIGGHVGRSKNTYMDNQSREVTYGTNLSPYVRKYFPLADRLVLHGTVYIAAGISKTNRKNYILDTGNEPTPQESTSKNISLTAGIQPGLTFFVTNKIGIDTSFGRLGYNRYVSSYDKNHRSTHENFHADLSLNSLSFGFQYFLSR